MKWVDAIAGLTAANEGFVVVTILDTRGSAPRERQAKMVVAETASYDTIGGGNLEYRAITHARRLLKIGNITSERRLYTLGKDLAQCCGGQVEVLFECFPGCDFNVVLFGAGHVGRAVIDILGQLPCRVTWQDSRKDVLMDGYDTCGQPGNVAPRVAANPWQAVERAPAGAWYLVMTHSHEWDFDLVEAILTRRDGAFCGMIGSASKAASFRGRLRRKGFSAEETGALVSPVGMDIGGGKLPMEVAISVTGQLIAEYRARRQQPGAGLTVVSGTAD